MYQNMYFCEISFITKTVTKFTSTCTGKLDVAPTFNNIFSTLFARKISVCKFVSKNGGKTALQTMIKLTPGANPTILFLC